MTFWLDAHLDPVLAPWMGGRFKLMVKALRDIGLRDADDMVLYEAARSFGKIVIVTKDSDFAGIVRRLGAPPQVLWLRCGNLSTIELQALLTRRFPEALEALRRDEALVELMP